METIEERLLKEIEDISDASIIYILNDECPSREEMEVILKAKLQQHRETRKEILERISKIDMTKFIPIGVDFYWKDWEEELKQEGSNSSQP